MSVSDTQAILTLTRSQVRDVDRRAIQDYGLPGVVLMENAGRGTAEWLRELEVTGPVAICCGKGNNGGDGFVFARHLDRHGIPVVVLLTVPASQLSGDAAVHFGVIRRAGIRIIEPTTPNTKSFPSTGGTVDLDAWQRELDASDWIVDALLGTGATGAVRDPLNSAIAAINASARKVMAVDLPSGMDADTGELLGPCVKATHTATFVAHKPCFYTANGHALAGQIRVIDIGVPRLLLTEILNQPVEPINSPSS